MKKVNADGICGCGRGKKAIMGDKGEAFECVHCFEENKTDKQKMEKMWGVEIDDGMIAYIQKTEDGEFEIMLNMYLFPLEFTSAAAENFEEAINIATAIYNIPEAKEGEGEQAAQIYDYDFMYADVEEIKELRIEGDYYFTAD